MNTKTKLLAAAMGSVLGAGAPAIALAQASVELYGSYDMSVINYKVTSSGTTPGVSRMVAYASGLRTTLGVRGRESLGGGLTAWFQAETTVMGDGRQNAPSSPAFAFGSRNSAVGLDGGFGRIFAGIWDTPYKVNMFPIIIASTQSTAGLYGNILGNPTGAGNTDTTGSVPNPNCQNLPTTAAPTAANPICGPTESGPVGFNRRASDVIQYWSPRFANTQFKFAYQAPEAKSGTTSQNPRLWSTALWYEAGPVTAAVGLERHTDFQFSGGSDRAWNVVASYELPIRLTLGGYYERITTDGPASGLNINARNWALLADYRLPGPGRVTFGYGKAADPTGAGATPDAGAKAYTLGYRHSFSKRTLVYAVYGKNDNNSGATRNFIGAPAGSNGVTSALAPGQDSSAIGVGITHTF